MSLICVRCSKIIVLSHNPDHFGRCPKCSASGIPLTDAEKREIRANKPSFKKGRSWV